MEPRAVARNTDPDTSWEAARRVERIRETQAEVLQAIRDIGPSTDEEIARHLHGTRRSMQSPSGLRTRRSELVTQGLLRDTGQRREGSTGRRMIVWGIPDPFTPNPISPLRGSPQAPPCSCGEGPVGHTTSHESTNEPGIVRIVREGKTDQYMNIRAVRAQAQAQAHKASREEEIERKRKTPRVDPRTHRLSLGGPLPCRKCGGTGGNLLEACYRCNGTGLTS